MAATKGKSKGKGETKAVRSASSLIKDEDNILAPYKLLSKDDVKKILDAEDVDQLERCVAKMLSLTNTACSWNEYIKLDYFVSGLWWCHEQNFTPEQMSVFYAFLDTLFKHIRKQMNLADVVMELKQFLIRICKGETDGNSANASVHFSSDQVMNIIDYFHSSLFQHHKLYDCYFQNPPQDFIIGLDVDLETPKPASFPWPAPLVESISLEMLKQLSGDPVEQDGQKEEKQEVQTVRSEADERLEEMLLSQLSPEEIKRLIRSVYSEMLAGVEVEIVEKIREQENAFINRINQICVISKR